MAEEKDKYVAAIEISSSKIIGVVGKYSSQGILDIIAIEQEKGLESVRYGLIRNVEEVWMRVMRVIQKLESKPAVAPRKITGVYYGLSGVSLRSIAVPVSITLSEDTEITDEILERLLSMTQSSAIDSSLEVVDAVPRVFKVGRQETLSPRGMVGNSISGEFDLIVCRKDMMRNISRVFEDKFKLSLKNQGVVVTALATGQLVLTDEEKRLGCMLVDMGAETTTVTIYKSGHLVYFATLPMGGRNITRDLTSLPLLEEDAEKIKITSASAVPREGGSNLNYNGVKNSEVSNLVIARAEEIVVNIIKQIRYAGLKDADIPAGIICIGGASQLHGINDLLASKSGLQVRRGSLPQYVMVHDMTVPGPELIEVASVLYAGAMMSDSECLEIVKVEELPEDPVEEEEKPEEKISEPKKPKGGFTWFTKFLNKSKESVSGMFSDTDDDQDVF